MCMAVLSSTVDYQLMQLVALMIKYASVWFDSACLHHHVTGVLME